MVDSPDSDHSMPVQGIKALPPTTVRQIGASQALVDPSSVAKELIDNALDARATAIWVEITANTIDSIQVKDNGHGIPAEDRVLVCRRYCTSKIRNFNDLKEVGGKWLGFRGEAMASMAEMSGSLAVTSRVEGEPVAVLLKFGRNGELMSTDRASHPVGTTVKVADLFRSHPVRKQAALKHSAKWLAKVRRFMQAYALARPTVRFQLRILKARNDKGNFNYAPKTGASVEDAAYKVIGRDCASQCDWTAQEANGFEIHALLPKPGAIASKVANEGAFISIDGRPMCASRGTLKKIMTKFKERLRKTDSSLASIKDPFMCLNIICPPNSYDPNIEPAKDDVLFENSDLVIESVDSLFKAFYPEGISLNEFVDDESVTSVQPPQKPIRPGTSCTMLFEIQEGVRQETEPSLSSAREEPQWRSNMYGIDEEDLVLLSQNQPPPVVEEDEDVHQDVSISNPWTIAKLNTVRKGKIPVGNGQLLTPSKELGDLAMVSSSPVAQGNRRIPAPLPPMSPQSADRQRSTNCPASNMNQQSIRELLQSPSRRSDRSTSSFGQYPETYRRLTELQPRPNHPDSTTTNTGLKLNKFPTLQAHHPTSRLVLENTPGSFASSPTPAGMPVADIPTASRARPPGQRKPRHANNKPFFPPFKRGKNDNMGQEVARGFDDPLDYRSARPSGNVATAAERILDNRLAMRSKDTDIRNFFGGKKPSRYNTRHQDKPLGSSTESSLPPIIPSGSIIDRSQCQANEFLPPPISQQEITRQLRKHEECLDHTPNNTHRPRRRSTPFSKVGNISQTNSAPAITHQRSRTLSHPYLTRSKSSKLPLERTPTGFYTKNLLLHLLPTISLIKDSMRKLDMSASALGNGIEWGYAAGLECMGFIEPVTEGRIAMWAGVLGGFLNERFELDESCEGRDPVELLVQGIKCALKGTFHGHVQSGYVVGEDEDEEMLPV